MRRAYVWDHESRSMVEKVHIERERIAPDVTVRGDICFESKQMPKWSKHHQGGFSADGKPQFTSRLQANEYAKRVSGEEDTVCEYGEM